MAEVAGGPSGVLFDDGLCVIVNASALGPSSSADNADVCEGGWIIQAALPRNIGICIAWMLILAWIFLGVAMGADVFMAAIERITSKEVTRTVTTSTGQSKTFHMRMWNETVANLTLMALGSSAPEILINVLEIILGRFYAGALGPSTIVGSAAFNLMVITAVCVIAMPPGETRTIKNLSVFLTTAAFSVLAYIWLLVIVALPPSPNVITIYEGLITIGLLFILIALAYYFDKKGAKEKPQRLRLASPYAPNDREARRASQIESYAIVKEAGLLDAPGKKDARSPEELADALRELAPPKRKHAYRREMMMNLPGKVSAVGGGASSLLKRAETVGGMQVHPADGTVASADGAPKARRLSENDVTPPSSMVGGGRVGLPSAVEAQQQSGGSPKPLTKATTAPNVLDVSMPRRLSADIRVPPAGMLRWVEETTSVVESAGLVVLKVERVGGSEGALSVHFATKDQQARGGKDYESASGSLEWTDGDVSVKEVPVTIIDDDELEKDETFTVVLSDIEGGAIFDAETDGGKNEAICTVTIVNDDARATRFAKALQILRMDMDLLDLSRISYGQQIKEAVTCPRDAGALGVVLFVLALPWRLMFSFVPPPELGGGWASFWCALLGIGFQVLLISDFANQMGCQMGLKPGFTAITFVALGTSLPDLFASKQAAIGDKTADNSIGNVTGSNSVNVFFGLGLPWSFAAIVWAVKGADQEWCDMVGSLGLTGVIADFPAGAFVVKAEGLGFSVSVFCVCALLTIVTILLRRPAELGGKVLGTRATATFFISLWVVYVLLSGLAEYKVITPPF